MKTRFLPIAALLPKGSFSIASYNNYLEKKVGVLFLENELKQQYVFSTTGKLVKEVTPDSPAYKIFHALEYPAYNHIQRPALAIYVKVDVQHLIPYYAYLDVAGKKQAAAFSYTLAHYQTEEEARFKKEILHWVVKEVVGANHSLFISDKGKLEGWLGGGYKGSPSRLK